MHDTSLVFFVPFYKVLYKACSSFCQMWALQTFHECGQLRVALGNEELAQNSGEVDQG